MGFGQRAVRWLVRTGLWRSRTRALIILVLRFVFVFFLRRRGGGADVPPSPVSTSVPPVSRRN